MIGYPEPGMEGEDRERFANEVRRTIIEQSYRANVGHIGSALSIADLVAAVIAGPARLGDADDRDRIVLSKGHAALALYAALHLHGRLEEGAIETYCADGSLLGVHPEHGLEGVDFCTGSLGQGLSLGTGAALGAKLQGSDRHIYVIVSDAELNEGSTWEAAMFAAQHQLDNLVLLVDLNGQQALGYTSEVMDLGAVEEKLAAFGWSVKAVHGHDHEALAAALEPPGDGRPHAIVAQTTFGYGVSFMESKIEWHYLPLDEETYARALAELDERAAA
ncbi:MAG: 1-deoxy-D-xylulose-5-phosphate synthase N-terminal domain-containing protein [Solirubrobacterales bacterium]